VLRRELQNFRPEITPSGRETWNAASGSHDDLIIATALCSWYLQGGMSGWGAPSPFLAAVAAGLGARAAEMITETFCVGVDLGPIDRQHCGRDVRAARRARIRGVMAFTRRWSRRPPFENHSVPTSSYDVLILLGRRLGLRNQYIVGRSAECSFQPPGNAYNRLRFGPADRLSAGARALVMPAGAL
jgi:hypothetical protein